jgi:uncharacterized protein involved in exopolysaccharide biosynthesis
MTEGRTSAAATSAAPHEEVNLLDYLATIWRFRILVAAVWIALVAATAIVSLVMPKVYVSTTRLLPPRESSTGSLLGALGGLTQALPVPTGLPSTAPNRDLVVSALYSRTVAESVVRRFNLQERYEKLYVEEAIRELQQNRTTIETTKEGAIVITVEDWDPKLAAEMANSFAEQADRVLAKSGIGEAGRQAKYVAEQLTRTRAELDASENALRKFQEKNRAIVLETQTRGAIEAAARLKGEIIAAEVQLEVTRQFMTDASPDVVGLRQRIGEMKRQLAEMQYGDGGGAYKANGAVRAADRPDFHVPFSRVPEVGLDLVRLTRDVKVQETLVLLLTQQLEQARLTEAKDLPIVQILDRAVPAELHARPRLLLYVAVAAVGGAVIAVFVALFTDHLRRLAAVRAARTAP